MNKTTTQDHIVHQYNRTLTFYGLSMAIPWALWFALAWLSHRPAAGDTSLVVQQILAMTGLIAPNLVALTLIFQKRELVADFRNRLFNLRNYNHVYTFLAALLIFSAMVLAQLISVAFGHSISQFTVTGQPSFTSFLFSPWLILVTAPIFEEFAWHCYGTDTLRRRFNLFSTSMIFALYWVLWHLPLGFVKGYYHSNVMAEGALYSLNFVFSLFVFVILMNWLYYKAKRNILVTILFHLSANISNEIFATHPDSKVIQTGLLLIVVIFVLVKERKMFFNKEVLD